MHPRRRSAEQLTKRLHVTGIIVVDFIVRLHAFMADVDGEDIPLVSPRRFKIMCSPRLDARICDMLCAAICLLLLGSASGAHPPWTVSTPGNSKSGGCLAFVTHSVKRQRRMSAEVV